MSNPLDDIVSVADAYKATHWPTYKLGDKEDLQLLNGYRFNLQSEMLYAKHSPEAGATEVEAVQKNMREFFESQKNPGTTERLFTEEQIKKILIKEMQAAEAGIERANHAGLDHTQGDPVFIGENIPLVRR